MRSSSLHRNAVALLVCGLWSLPARAQQTQGFALERFSPAAAGGGWLVMDSLDWRAGLGGALSLTGGYARLPLSIAGPSGTGKLGLVSDEAVATVAGAVSWERFRLSLDLTSPLLVSGQSGSVGGRALVAPAVTVGNNPDTLSDVRVGFDARVLGAPGDALRLALSAQLFIPSGSRTDYDTDGTFRAMLRLLAAGNAGAFEYAGQLGVHVRPLDVPQIPGGPAGSELTFGAAAGPRTLWGSWAVIVGPEVYGETALESFFGGTTTGIEALLTGRIEGTGEGAQPRFKLGVGVGLDPSFGAPEWRIVFSAELFSRRTALAR